MLNHTIAMYPALTKRLEARGWTIANVFRQVVVYGKRRGNYAQLVKLDHAKQRATFSHYNRLSK